jgi:hypothetical protein
MKCAICKCPAPGDQDATIDAGWIPYYYVGQCEMPGPVCPDCRTKHLRRSEDGEWEAVPPLADAHRWN